MSQQQERFLAIVNPAAGGGKSAKLAGETLAQLRKSGLAVDVIATTSSGHASELAAEAYTQGYRRFIAVGGDGTAHEILNGLFGRPKPQDRISLGFLPLGTGNSFLRDFAEDGADAAFRALLAGRTRPVDLIRLTHSDGEIYSLNILSLGFTADVGALTNRYFKPLGPLGYLLGVIAPDADSTDGYIEFVRWGPIGRLGLLRALPRLYDGSHIKHPLASRRAVRHVEFNLPVPVDVLVDGEILTLECRSIDILPGALDVYI